MNYNKVILSGNITRDAELKHTDSGFAIGKIGLAVNRNYKKNDEWQKEVLFVDITVFGDAAERVVPQLVKGTNVFIDGYLKLEQWKDKDDNNRSKISVVAQKITPVTVKSNGESNGEPSVTKEKVFEEVTPF